MNPSNRVSVSLAEASVMREVVTLLPSVDLNHAILLPLIRWKMHVDKFVANMYNIVHTAFSFAVA